MSTRSKRKKSSRSLRPRYAKHGNPRPTRRCTADTAMQHSSGNQKAEEEANKETEAKIKEIKDIGSKSGSKVVEQLLAAVTDVKPEPPAKD